MLSLLVITLLVLAFAAAVGYGAYLLGRDAEAQEWVAASYDPYDGVGRPPKAANGGLFYVVTAGERLDMLNPPVVEIIKTETVVDVRVVNPLLTLPYPAALEQPPRPILLGVV